jgi:hypothetical protein
MYDFGSPIGKVLNRAMQRCDFHEIWPCADYLNYFHLEIFEGNDGGKDKENELRCKSYEVRTEYSKKDVFLPDD